MLRQEPGKKARPNTRKVRVGSVDIGGGSPVSIQTMWKSPLGSADSDLIRQIEGLASLGCDIMRFAVPNTEAADILGELAGSLKIPLVADIHFDYRIALRCLDWPVAKVRINPGNIGAGWKVEEVVRKAMDKGAAMRVGINGGSLPRNLRDEPDMGEAMVKAAEDELDILEKLGFEDVIFSLKSSDMESTLHANRLFAQRHRYPLHLGLTESGPLIPGLVRSTIVLAQLLREGIGDTIRISLSSSEENEVLAGRALLASCGMQRAEVQIVSCPTCGRTEFDVRGFLDQVYPFLIKQKRRMVVAIMGCSVNGPGEAKHADIGITGTSKYAVIFKRGTIVRRVPIAEALAAFKEEIKNAEKS